MPPCSLRCGDEFRPRRFKGKTKNPEGADVYFKEYGDVDGPRLLAGRVPIDGARIPLGELRWRLVKDGFDAAEGASPQSPSITIRRTGEAPLGMVHVPGGSALNDEVTNAEFKRFVDGGGYRERKYWNESFDVAAQLRDKTGQPGPATWELGTFPEGRDDALVRRVPDCALHPHACCREQVTPRFIPEKMLRGCDVIRRRGVAD